MLRIAHYACHVNIHGLFPAESIIKQIILGRGGKIFHAAHNVGYAHSMVVYNVCKVIGGHAVRLNEYHVVKLRAIHLYVAVYGVVKACLAVLGHVLADNIRLSRGKASLNLRLIHMQAMLVVLKRFAPFGGGGAARVQLFVGAEAIISLAHFNKPLCVGQIHILPFALHIRAEFAAHVRAFVPVHAYAFKRAVNNLRRAFNIAIAVGILNAQYEFAAMVARIQPSVKRAPEVAYVHIPRRGRGKSCSDHISHLCLLCNKIVLPIVFPVGL